jgi:hypothetical protein
MTSPLAVLRAGEWEHCGKIRAAGCRHCPTCGQERGAIPPPPEPTQALPVLPVFIVYRTTQVVETTTIRAESLEAVRTSLAQGDRHTWTVVEQSVERLDVKERLTP